MCNSIVSLPEHCLFIYVDVILVYLNFRICGGNKDIHACIIVIIVIIMIIISIIIIM